MIMGNDKQPFGNEEFGISGSQRNPLSAPGLEGLACSNAIRTLRGPDGGPLRRRSCF
jgi:hypothetical protein